jgi:hypothetical protein
LNAEQVLSYYKPEFSWQDMERKRLQLEKEIK